MLENQIDEIRQSLLARPITLPLPLRDPSGLAVLPTKPVAPSSKTCAPEPAHLGGLFYFLSCNRQSSLSTD